MRKTMETIQQKTGRIYHPPCLMKTLRNCEVILILRNHQPTVRSTSPLTDVYYINFYAITNYNKKS